MKKYASAISIHYEIQNLNKTVKNENEELEKLLNDMKISKIDIDLNLKEIFKNKLAYKSKERRIERNRSR